MVQWILNYVANRVSIFRFDSMLNGDCGLLLISILTILSYIVYGIALPNLVALNEEWHFPAEESEIINKTSLVDEEK